MYVLHSDGRLESAVVELGVRVFIEWDVQYEMVSGKGKHAP